MRSRLLHAAGCVIKWDKIVSPVPIGVQKSLVWLHLVDLPWSMIRPALVLLDEESALSEIDLPGEVSGNIPTAAWKQSVYNNSWQMGDGSGSPTDACRMAALLVFGLISPN